MFQTLNDTRRPRLEGQEQKANEVVAYSIATEMSMRGRNKKRRANL
jgi:hypothetical protein